MSTIAISYENVTRIIVKWLTNSLQNTGTYSGIYTHWTIARPRRGNHHYGHWYIHTDPSVGLELLEDDWLQNKELWQVDQDWTWAHVYDFLALLTIDVALANAERGQPYKAAVTAARSSEYHGIATAARWAETASAAAVSTLGKRGSDVRHSSNRAAKEEAIQLYVEKTWTSQAQAARVIGTKVNKTERVVEKWLREFKKVTLAAERPLSS